MADIRNPDTCSAGALGNGSKSGSAAKQNDARANNQPPQSQGSLQGWRSREQMLDELPGILSCNSTDVPIVFFNDVTLPLKINVDLDLVERFPKVDTVKLGRWLTWWTRSYRYMVEVAKGSPRHDLDGIVVEKPAPEHVEQAKRSIFAPPKKAPLTSANGTAGTKRPKLTLSGKWRPSSRANLDRDYIARLIQKGHR